MQIDETENAAVDGSHGEQWPATMPCLEPGHFITGWWCRTSDGRPISNKPPTHPAVCGSRCCLVGHVRHAFGLPANPDYGPQLPREGVEFLRRFLLNAGYPVDDTVLEFHDDPEGVASDCFEGFDGYGALTPRKAAVAWKKTLEELDYEVTDEDWEPPTIAPAAE